MINPTPEITELMQRLTESVNHSADAMVAYTTMADEMGTLFKGAVKQAANDHERITVWGLAAAFHEHLAKIETAWHIHQSNEPVSSRQAPMD